MADPVANPPPVVDWMISNWTDESVKAFRRFALSEYSPENISFMRRMYVFKANMADESAQAVSARFADIQKIFNAYIEPKPFGHPSDQGEAFVNGALQSGMINIGGESLKRIEDFWTTHPEVQKPASEVDHATAMSAISAFVDATTPATSEIRDLLQSDTFRRFKSANETQWKHITEEATPKPALPLPVMQPISAPDLVQPVEPPVAPDPPAGAGASPAQGDHPFDGSDLHADPSEPLEEGRGRSGAVSGPDAPA